MNIIDAINDKNLFRPFLQDKSGSIDSWSNWLVALRALHGLPITTKADRALVKTCTGRTKLRKGGFTTALYLTGRRSGKSRQASCMAAYEAVLGGHEAKLAKGEKGVVLVVSPTRAQSKVVHDYLRAIFTTPMLQREVVSETKDVFELRSGTRIQVLCGDYRSVRGFTLVCAVIDEACFFGYSDEAKVKSDTELVRAIKPALATVNGRLIAISSPYAQKGWAYNSYRKYFGNDKATVLVWNCASRVMNPTLPQSIIDEAEEEDLASARAEYGGLFRDDIVTFLPREVIESCVIKGRAELPPRDKIQYSCFVDLSGGRADDAALAIAHLADDEDGNKKVVLDLVRGWKPPFNPDAVVGQMVDVLVPYRIGEVTGDNYSAEFVKSSFESRGVRYERCTTNPWGRLPNLKTAKPKSQLYLELLPRLCAGQIELLDNAQLINQLAGLERKTRAGGRDIIDHGPNQKDDVANVCAGVCVLAQHPQLVVRAPVGLFAGEEAKDPFTAFRQRQLDYQREQAELKRQTSNQRSDIEQALKDGTFSVVTPATFFNY